MIKAFRAERASEVVQAAASRLGPATLTVEQVASSANALMSIYSMLVTLISRRVIPMEFVIGIDGISHVMRALGFTSSDLRSMANAMERDASEWG